ncbi:MAG: DUF6056 family protein, partial [Verrucomicrobiota bacterium]|nr:DUF6056 family protein [Verrucomicrobiota bacterium]
VQAYAGIYSRYSADDFCTAASLRSRGFLGAQLYWFTKWSGRFSFTFAVSLIELAGIRLVPALTFVHAVAWLLLLAWALEALTSFDGPRRNRIGNFLIASILVSATLGAAPDLYQSFYWQIGILTYVTPFLILPAIAGVISSKRHPISRALLSFILAFVAAGFSETFAATQAGLATAILGTATVFRRRDFVVKLLPGVLGAIAGAVIVAIAPGNKYRAISEAMDSSSPPSHDLVMAIHSLGNMTAAILKDAIHSRLLTALVVALPASVAISAKTTKTITGKSALIMLTLIGASTLVAVAFSLAPVVYVQYSIRGDFGPATRLLIVPCFFRFAGLAAAGYVVGMCWKQTNLFKEHQWWLAPGLMLFLLCCCFYSSVNVIRRTIHGVPMLQEFAKRFDAQQRYLSTTKLQAVELEAPIMTELDSQGGDFFGTLGMTANPQFWVNECAAEYYGVQTIIVRAAPDRSSKNPEIHIGMIEK